MLAYHDKPVGIAEVPLKDQPREQMWRRLDGMSLVTGELSGFLIIRQNCSNRRLRDLPRSWTPERLWNAYAALEKDKSVAHPGR
jgi:hypothetical protein